MDDLHPLTLEAVRKSNLAALTRAQVAELLRVDPRTVTRSIEDGSLPSIRLGRRVLVPREPLLRMLDAGAPGAPQKERIPA